MLDLKIDKSWPLPPGEQLKAHLRARVKGGELRPGVVLPTVKQMAQKVGLNANTVAAAYRGLAVEGFFVMRRRGGTRVAPGPFLRTRAEAELSLLADRLIRHAHALELSGGDVLRLVAGRWAAAQASPPMVAAPAATTIYEFIRERNYDEA